MKVGFIGLGIMGSRMAANLLRNGNELVVYNRTKEKAGPLIGQGAVFVPTPARVAESVSVIITMLAEPTAVTDVALGEDGFLNRFTRGSLWIDCSSVNPSFSRKAAAECVKRGVRFLDASVAGSKVPAEQGQLIFFVGGERDDVEFSRPLLETMGKAVFHIGGHGMGAAMKMVNNLLLAGAMAAFSEGLVLGESLGIARDVLFEALLASPVAAPVLGLKKPLIESGTFEAQFPLKWMHKDLQLASVTAYECGVAMPSSHAIKELFALAIREGLGEKDFAALYQYLKESRQG
ncbi:MAG: NAD(P)-dependent oxidoreductase [Thermodesulfovibrionales bacterium]|jgi:3-hydroxyisobutyrate dehydrogenase/glyoxylate/succinic semialdehyde reductase